MAGRKIIAGIVFMSIVVLCLIGYTIFQLENLMELRNHLATSLQIKSDLLGFFSEWLYTGLEQWEYYYDPSVARFQAIQQHAQAANLTFDKLEANSKSAGPVLYDGGLDDISELKSLSASYHQSLPALFAIVERYRLAKEADLPLNELHVIEMRAAVLESESRFDSLGIEGKISHMISAQDSHVDRLYNDFKKIELNIGVTLLILAAAYLILLALVCAWLNWLACEHGKKEGGKKPGKFESPIRPVL